MMKTMWKRIMLLVSVLVGFAVPLTAQTADAVELIGSVEAMTLNTITVNGQEIDVATAQMNTQIELGTIVEVQGNLTDDGGITAREVNAVDENVEPGEAELIGQLESFDGTTLVMSGQTIDVSNAEVQDGITFGGFVRVHVVSDDTGGWTAREAAPFVPDETDDTPLASGEFEIIGTLEEIGDEEVVVAGQTILVNDATEIEATLLTGVRVKVRFRSEDGAWAALAIENAVDNEDNQGSNDNDNSNNNTNSNENANANDNTNGNDNSTNANTAISQQAATDIVLGIFPNTRIVSIELTEKFGGTQVWEVHTSHGIELNIDAQDGTILTIERGDSANTNSNTNANTNTNDNTNVNTNANTNSNTNANDNSDDNDDDDNGNDNDNDDSDNDNDDDD